ncbi:MAG: FtsX-like permease family protein [Planctomycetales bacterium]|nr:FtsX-like permease family protein [Planctomycetales bacterium]
MPYDFYQQFTEYQNPQGQKVRGKFAGAVKVAVPYCLGDSYQEFRVVGTTAALFDKISYGAHQDGTPKRYEFAEGRNFRDDEFHGAVIGAIAARRAGLRLGDRFPITHGLADDENAHVHDEELFEVMGILAATGTPNDRAVFVNMEGFYLLGGHALIMEEEEDPVPADAPPQEAAASPPPPATAAVAAVSDPSAAEGPTSAPKLKPLPIDQREVTAILLLLADDAYALGLSKQINKGRVAQAVFPTREVAQLFEGLVGYVRAILLVLAVLVIVVAGVGVMVSIYNSMNDRSREIGVMRALGAGRATVMIVVLLESILLSLLGGLAGVLLGHGTMAILSPLVLNLTGVTIHAFQFDLAELILIPSLILLATLAGYLPALTAYRTDVAKALTASP